MRARETSDTNRLGLAMADAGAGDTNEAGGTTGGKSMARQVAQQSGGTGTPGHSGTGGKPSTPITGGTAGGAFGGTGASGDPLA